jgi:hypothetical protein
MVFEHIDRHCVCYLTSRSFKLLPFCMPLQASCSDRSSLLSAQGISKGSKLYLANHPSSQPPPPPPRQRRKSSPTQAPPFLQEPASPEPQPQQQQQQQQQVEEQEDQQQGQQQSHNVQGSKLGGKKPPSIGAAAFEARRSGAAIAQLLGSVQVPSTGE